MTPRSNVLMATSEQITGKARPRRSSSRSAFSLHQKLRGIAPHPAELAHILESVLHTLVRGGSFTIETMPEFLTTTQAAKLLGESRPTLMKRIPSGELPSTLVGTHHRLRSSDVIALRKEQFKQRRAEVLEFLSLEDKLGL